MYYFMSILVGLMAISCSHIQKQKKEEVFVQNASEVVIGHKNYWLKRQDEPKGREHKLDRSFATGDWVEMEKRARLLLQQRPKSSKGLSMLAVATSMRGKPSLGVYYADLHEKFYGRTAVTLNVSGLAMLQHPHMTEKRLMKVVDIFQEAFDRSPSEVAAGLNLAHLYLEVGNPESAANIFLETMKRCDNCTPALVGIGIAKQRMGDFKSAKMHFKNALDQDENNATALYRMSMLSYHHEKDVELSRGYMKRMLTHAPENSMLRVRGEAFIRTMDQKESEHYEVVDDNRGGNEYYESQFKKN